jgi:hypothetical protein
MSCAAGCWGQRKIGGAGRLLAPPAAAVASGWQRCRAQALQALEVVVVVQVGRRHHPSIARHATSPLRRPQMLRSPAALQAVCMPLCQRRELGAGEREARAGAAAAPAICRGAATAPGSAARNSGPSNNTVRGSPRSHCFWGPNSISPQLPSSPHLILQLCNECSQWPHFPPLAQLAPPVAGSRRRWPLARSPSQRQQGGVP